jgi:hypothetical protein
MPALAGLATGLAVLLDVAIAFIGLRFFYDPPAAIKGYGVPAIPSQVAAYTSIKSNRDITVGVIGLTLLYFEGMRSEAWFMLAVSIAPLCDTLIVLRHGGEKSVAFGVHFATAVVCLLDSWLLFNASRSL